MISTGRGGTWKTPDVFERADLWFSRRHTINLARRTTIRNSSGIRPAIDCISNSLTHCVMSCPLGGEKR